MDFPWLVFTGSQKMVPVFSNLDAMIQQFGCRNAVIWIPRFNNLDAAINYLPIAMVPRQLHIGQPQMAAHGPQSPSRPPVIQPVGVRPHPLAEMPMGPHSMTQLLLTPIRPDVRTYVGAAHM